MSWIDRIELYFLHHIILQNVSRSAECNFSSHEVTSQSQVDCCFTILKMWLPKLIGCCLSTQPQGRKSKGKCRSELWARIKTVKYHCCSYHYLEGVPRPHTYLQRMLGNETYPCAQRRINGLCWNASCLFNKNEERNWYSFNWCICSKHLSTSARSKLIPIEMENNWSPVKSVLFSFLDLENLCYFYLPTFHFILSFFW